MVGLPKLSLDEIINQLNKNIIDFVIFTCYTVYIGGHMNTVTFKEESVLNALPAYVFELKKTTPVVKDGVETVETVVVKRFLIPTKTLARECAEMLNLDIRDFDYALNSFEEHGHNKAEFGTFGGLINSEYVGGKDL